MTMTFIQHLLENEPPARPTSMSHEEKTQLMQLLSKAFVVSQSTDIDTNEFYKIALKVSDLIEQIPEDEGMDMNSEEEEPKMQANRDIASGIDFQQDANDEANRSTPSRKRAGQRAGRNLRRRSGRLGTRPNAAGFMGV